MLATTWGMIRAEQARHSAVSAQLAEAERAEGERRAKEEAQKRTSSPDLTHRRVVVEGDTLPQLCREIYGSPEHYLRVAQVNGLDDFRDLSPGQELFFPPYERPGGA